MSGSWKQTPIFGVAAARWYQPARPERNPDYLRFIRRLRCIVCSSPKHIEAAHFGPRGLGQKASDRQALPLCRRHHQTGNDSYHKLGPAKFALVHQLDAAQLILLLNTFFDENLKRGRL